MSHGIKVYLGTIGILGGWTMTLSIRRVLPTRAAIARSVGPLIAWTGLRVRESTSSVLLTNICHQVSRCCPASRSLASRAI